MSYAADLSSFNAPASQIDWAQYIAWSKQGDGVSRLIIRACDGLVHDTNWGGYVAAARAAAIDEIIHYQFNNPDLNSAQVEADFLIALVRNSLRPQDTLMADFEKSVPQADGAWALNWLQHVQAMTGHLPAFYSYLSYIETRLSTSTALAAYPLGLAAYVPQQPAAPAPWSSMRWWQYSDRGSVPGIPGLVDVNQFFGGASMLPPEWTDDGTALHNPANSFVITGGFRQHVLDAPAWSEGNIPLQNEQALGNGDAEQVCRYTLLEFDPQNGTTEGWIGDALLAARAKIAELEAQQPPPALTPAQQAWLDVGPVFKAALSGI